MSGPIADEKYDAAQREFRAAATAMEKLANRVIERLIRQGYASRSDVVHLLPEVEKHSRVQRMRSTTVTPDEIKRATNLDLATRLRLKREGKLS